MSDIRYASAYVEKQIAGSGKESGSRKSLLRVTSASLAGTTLEFYDHFIYGTASALVFPKVFFTQMTPQLALLLSLVTYGIAFVARPIGAVIFGHFGDRIGRKNMLVAALFIMGLATFLIGCLPGYATAGPLGAYCLCALRLLQGIALGGEWGGAALMVNEFAKESKYKGFLGSMVQIASPIGFLLASGIFAMLTNLLPDESFLSWGWRVPFVASAFLVIVGLYIRLGITESPEFLENKKLAPTHEAVPIYTVLKHHCGRLLLAIGTRIGSDIAFYVFALFPLVYLPHIGIPKQVALHASIAAALGQACGIPLFGYFCDRFSTHAVLAFGAIANLIWVFVFFALLDTGSTGIILAAAFVALFLLAAMWAPLAAHLPRMFPVEVRFTGAGLGFQAAGILGGALAPGICLTLLRSQGTMSISLYLGATLVLALCCISASYSSMKRRP